MRTEEFKHIILPMRSDLKAYALRLTESDDNAEDLVQEVMLRLWDMRQNIKAEDNLKALAITIMRNKFYDQCRHEERNFTTDKVMEVPIEDRRAEQRDEVNLIKQIVAQLPPLQQQIFRMKEKGLADKLVICVPSGNFGNITAGLFGNGRLHFCRFTHYAQGDGR